MKDVGVVKQVVSGTQFITTVGGKNTKVRDKGITTETILDEYLGPKYGNFLEPNAEEIKIIGKYQQAAVEKLIQNAFRR